MLTLNIPNAPFISRVEIKNFKNFRHVVADLTHKQVIIGENNTGKTNFLKAIQLILDPGLTDEDRFLNQSDFYDGLENPMDLGEDIFISIEIRGFEHNKTLLALFSDGTIASNPATLRLTYHFFPTQNDDGTNEYQYQIYQGTRMDVPFTHRHRRYLNIKVIPALRDVESEMKSLRKSPINQLLKHYDIRMEELKSIAEKLKETSDEVLSIDELVHLKDSINSRFSTIIGEQVDSTISLDTMDFEPTRLLNTLKIMMGQNKRPTSHTSLGLTNILYISLILTLLEDKTIPYILKEDKYNKLLEEEGNEIVQKCYEQNQNRNYLLKDSLSTDELTVLYVFMDNYYSSNAGFTILAIEEPESHLHPALQRLIYKDVMKQNTSVLLTTHSPYITSVAPMQSIVHIRSLKDGTSVKTTASLQLSQRNKKDLERYLDVNRGEIYFGKGVILVEGIAEEYLIPSFADSLNMSLDKKGIICCNINSTNFKPYVQFLECLGIPYVVVTDGDYYHRVVEKGKQKKVYGEIYEKHHKLIGYDGLDRIKKLLTELNKVTSFPQKFNELDKLLTSLGFFIGEYTFEIDMMETSSDNNETEVFANVFEELTMGGDTQKLRFREALLNNDFVECLKKVESNYSKIGKGRFSQGLSTECTLNNIPDYIKEAITTIYSKVDTL
ncbi:ATP-dependent nuclease [Fictibacillus enclensis]|uniref:ATP-dependent nuclease n=1 Tax=Fictibacillus enclensis TaxID=1017270 RepID=UPI003337CCC4